MSYFLFRQVTSSLLAFGTLGSVLFADAVMPSLVRLGSRGVAQAQDIEEVNVRVYRQASPAVVSIQTQSGTGSGSIISPDGLILTNAHVVSNVRQVRVVLADGRRLDGEVIAFAEGGLDLAAVRVRAQNLPTIPLASAGSVQVGQRAFAIGNPFGQFQGTFTTGIVSRLDTNRGLIQTDAAINPGNSGGPLLNSQGQMIGVNSAIFSPRGAGGNTGIGFAISMDRVQPFLVAVREGRAPRTAQQAPQLGGGPNAQRITLNGSPVQGVLSSSSGVLSSDNSFFNAYTFEGQAGQQVTIEMTSRDVNPYLILLRPDGSDLAQDNDSAGDRNARLTTVLPETGLYTILANTFEPGETGRYRISASTGARPNTDTTPSPSARVLLQVEGSLGPNSLIWAEDNSPYQEYALDGRAGQTVTITMESIEFDTYIILLDSNGRVVGQNDDESTSSTNSQLTVTLPRTGTYRIIANAYDRNGRGRYVLTVR
jgi:S1-C subfamily serine protease